jgi:hypothetical protein
MGLTQNLGRLSPSIFSDSSLNIGVGAAPSGSYKFEVTGTSKVSGVLTLGSTLSNGTYTYTLPAATGTLALVGGAGVGTVTSVAALTLGTTGTDLSSTVANSTTTPVITLNVPTASAANRGALSSADWSTFNSKQGTITLTTTGTSGAATFSANTLNIPNYGSALSGYVPYTGATANLDLGAFSLTTFGVSSTNTISTTAGYGILSGGGGFSIGPSATRGIIAINGSGDQLLTFSTQSYIYNSSSLFRMLSSSDIDFVAGGTQRLLISASTGVATFTGQVEAASFYTNDTRYISNQIQSGYNTNSEDSDIWINYTGYQGGTTRFRDFRVGNGKQGQIAFFDGSAGTVTFSSSVTAGAAVFTATSLPLKIQSTTNYETSTLGAATGTMGYISANGLYGMYIGIGNSGNTWLQSQRNDGGTSAYNLLLNPSGGNVLIGTTTDDTVNKLQVNGNIAINKGAGNTAIFDSSGTVLSLATGGTADFAIFSGMLMVTNFNTGAFQIFVCGGGSTANVYTLGVSSGTFAYNIGINGYTFTSSAATATFNFTAFRTRPNA